MLRSLERDPFYRDAMRMVPHPPPRHDRQTMEQWPGTGSSVSGLGGAGEVQNTADKFRVRVDVSHFSPEELSVS